MKGVSNMFSNIGNYALKVLIAYVFFLGVSYANSLNKTHRIPQITNDKVNVWETIVYPNTNQALKSHRHEYDRVLVALDSGTLKITNNQGKIHYLTLEKNHSYYLTKDVAGEMHTDENISHHLIKAIVVELKSSNTRLCRQ